MKRLRRPLANGLAVFDRWLGGRLNTIGLLVIGVFLITLTFPLMFALLWLTETRRAIVLEGIAEATYYNPPAGPAGAEQVQMIEHLPVRNSASPLPRPLSCHAIDFSQLKSVKSPFSSPQPFIGRDLRGSRFSNCLLKDVDFRDADLTEATFYNCDLSWASLQGAAIENLRIEYCDVTALDLGGTKGLPTPDALATCSSIQLLRFKGDPRNGIELANVMRNLPFGQASRDLVYALRRREYDFSIMTRAGAPFPPGGEDQGEYVLRQPRDLLADLWSYTFIELTCGHGRAPWRPPILIVGLVPLFAGVYVISLRRRGRAGIFADLRSDPSGAHSPGSLGRVTDAFSPPWSSPLLASPLHPLRALSLALQFSVLCALAIGWNNLSLASWVQSLQRHDLEFRGSGWVRTVAGFQALVGMYLIALWIWAMLDALK